MEQKVLHAEVREERGKGPAGRLRRGGRIPAVVYGHQSTTAVSISAREFTKAFHTISESQIVDLKVGEADHQVLIKDYSEDIRTGEILHIDFYEIEKGRKLRTHIAIELKGSPIGVRTGGVLEHLLYELDIECLPKDLPEHMAVDISALETGDSLHVSEIPVPDGVRILNNPEQTVVAITVPRAAVETEAEEDEEREAVAGEAAASE